MKTKAVRKHHPAIPLMNPRTVTRFAVSLLAVVSTAFVLALPAGAQRDAAAAAEQTPDVEAAELRVSESEIALDTYRRQMVAMEFEVQAAAAAGDPALAGIQAQLEKIRARAAQAETELKQAQAELRELRGEDAEHDVERPAAEHAGPVQLPARIQRVEQQHQVYFDENGEQRSESHQLRLNLILMLEDDRPVLGYENLRVTRVVTAAAETLRSQDGPQNNAHMHQIVGNRQPSPQVGIYCRLPVPSVPAESLQEVSGDLTLKLGAGPLREAVLGPFKEVAGRGAAIRGIEGSEVRVRNEDGRLRVEMSQAVRDLVSRVRLVNERGVDIPTNSWGSGSSDNLHYVSLRVTPNDTDQVIFELFDRVIEQPATFSLNDVPLPVPDAQGGGVELVLDALPVGEAVAPKPLERLPVIFDDAGHAPEAH